MAEMLCHEMEVDALVVGEDCVVSHAPEWEGDGVLEWAHPDPHAVVERRELIVDPQAALWLHEPKPNQAMGESFEGREVQELQQVDSTDSDDDDDGDDGNVSIEPTGEGTNIRCILVRYKYHLVSPRWLARA